VLQSRHAKDAQKVIAEYVILSYITICKKTCRNGMKKYKTDRLSPKRKTITPKEDDLFRAV